MIRVLVTIPVRKIICLGKIICLYYRLFTHKLMSFWLFDSCFIIVYSRFLLLMNSMRFILDVMFVFNMMVHLLI